MAIFYMAGGVQWFCKRCKTTVRARKDGTGQCACKTSPSPWEPVCRKCLHFYRERTAKWQLKRLSLPFSQEKVWRLSLLGWTLEWSYGSCETDVSNISETPL